jgi:hypothetical protein
LGYDTRRSANRKLEYAQKSKKLVFFIELTCWAAQNSVQNVTLLRRILAWMQAGGCNYAERAESFDGILAARFEEETK